MEDERQISYHEKWEREYKRRMRRRKVILARCIVAVAGIALILLFGTGVRALVRKIGDRKPAKANTQSKKDAKADNYDNVYVPEGYEEYFKKLKKLQKEEEEVDTVIQNISDYPTEYLDMLLDNVETLQYVAEYPEHKYDTKEGKITEKITIGKIPLLNQWDTRWGYLSYGDNKIAWNGCGPTALSMVVVGLTGDTSVTPKKIAEFSEKNDYYDNSVGTKWSLMSQGASAFGLSITTVPLQAEDIVEQLQMGKPIICSMMPGDFTRYGHFIVLTGLDKKGRIKVNDPNSIARSKKHWDVDVLVSQIKGLWSYEAVP